MLKLRMTGIVLSLGESEGLLKEKTALTLGIPEESILSLRVIRKSIDARRRENPRFVYSVDVSVPTGINLPVNKSRDIYIEVLKEQVKPPCRPAKMKPAKRPVVVGCGPAGLFAALTMAGRGIPPLLLERGKKISERISDVHAFWERGILNTESHVHFGNRQPRHIGELLQQLVAIRLALTQDSHHSQLDQTFSDLSNPGAHETAPLPRSEL